MHRLGGPHFVKGRQGQDTHTLPMGGGPSFTLASLSQALWLVPLLLTSCLRVAWLSPFGSFLYTHSLDDLTQSNGLEII